jgi:2-polyprenyl-6-methoxyphenol hydroxylase-like FAD-dependent oxidoreductase
MALEDAVCLDAVLRKEQNLAGAFARLETLRARRTAQAQLTSRRMGEEVYHPAGGKP